MGEQNGNVIVKVKEPKVNFQMNTVENANTASAGVGVSGNKGSADDCSSIICYTAFIMLCMTTTIAAITAGIILWVNVQQRTIGRQCYL